MKSMTGFGRGSFSGENFAVSIELKTVNNRFLDVNMRLPNDLQPLEAVLKRHISNRLSRGRVDVNINFERTSEIVYELNRPLIKGYVAALREMQSEFNLSGELDLNVIARLPNVLQNSRDDLNEDMKSGIESALKIALNELEKMRENEGANLQTELTTRLDEIEKQIPIITTNADKIIENHQARLSKRINELLLKNETAIEIDQSRLAQEIAYLAERSDIAEELARLKSHIEQFRQICEASAEAGKQLDFLTQELNREANTILSKATDLIIKDAGLKIKAEIEKLREQIQNVE
ncbi:MAG: YicC family protein [Pyrinomonadaceae bacterium]|nr:YicC family protein [Pyrinomonadaceae bacterium]